LGFDPKMALNPVHWVYDKAGHSYTSTLSAVFSGGGGAFGAGLINVIKPWAVTPATVRPTSPKPISPAVVSTPNPGTEGSRS
jgi:hypothetical protein